MSLVVCFFITSSVCCHHIDHVEDIVKAAFQYLAMVRREGPQESYGPNYMTLT